MKLVDVGIEKREGTLRRGLIKTRSERRIKDLNRKSISLQ
jgi:hypothetical protein